MRPVWNQNEIEKLRKILRENGGMIMGSACVVAVDEFLRLRKACDEAILAEDKVEAVKKIQEICEWQTTV